MSSWIDVSIVHSILTGGILLVFGFWVWLAYIHLWREYLLEACSEAMDLCEEQGFILVSSALRTEVQMIKDDVCIYWKGGWSGEVTFLSRNGEKTAHRLVHEREKMSSLIGLSDPTSRPQID